MDLLTPPEFKLPGYKSALLSFSGLTLTTKGYVTYLMRSDASVRVDREGTLIKVNSKKQANRDARLPQQPRIYRLNKGKVKRRILTYSNLRSSKRFMAFYSISFPVHFPDAAALQCLNTVLTRIRKLRPSFSYIWVAERQKNQTIHYHMLTNNWLNVRIINHYFAKAIKHIIATRQLNHLNYNEQTYNGVDVRHVRNPSTLSNYICKYIAKQHNEWKQLCWNCSTSVSRLITFININKTKVIRIFQFIQHHLATAINFENFKPSEYCYYFPFLKSPPVQWFEDLNLVNESLHSVPI